MESNGVVIPTTEIIQQTIRAAIQDYINSEEGKLFLEEYISTTVTGYLSSGERWGSSLCSEIDNIIRTQAQKLLHINKVDDIAWDIMQIGVKKWLESIGYEVKNK